MKNAFAFDQQLANLIRYWNNIPILRQLLHFQLTNGVEPSKAPELPTKIFLTLIFSDAVAKK